MRQLEIIFKLHIQRYAEMKVYKSSRNFNPTLISSTMDLDTYVAPHGQH